MVPFFCIVVVCENYYRPVCFSCLSFLLPGFFYHDGLPVFFIDPLLFCVAAAVVNFYPGRALVVMVRFHDLGLWFNIIRFEVFLECFLDVVVIVINNSADFGIM